MAASTEPANKKQRLEVDPIFHSFLRHNKYETEQLKRGILAVQYGLSKCRVRTLKVVGADARCPGSFSRSKIFLEKTGDLQLYPFGELFEKACTMLNKYIQSDFEGDNLQLPDDSECTRALSLLLHYLQTLDKESRSLTQISSCSWEDYSWTLKLAQHVLSKLSLNPHYIYDNNVTHDTMDGCPCHEHDSMLGKKGDTSFGWEDGWHGKTDIVMGDVAVCKICDGADDVTQTSLSRVPSSSSLAETDSSMRIEVKTNSCSSPNKYCQILAETITFSFLKNKNKKEVTLIPSIVVNQDYIQVHFYDSERDVLIQSGQIQLTETKQDGEILTPIAVLVIWMTLNYGILCTGVIDGMKKSGFHELIDVGSYKRAVKAPCSLTENTNQKWVSDHKWA